MRLSRAIAAILLTALVPLVVLHGACGQVPDARANLDRDIAGLTACYRNSDYRCIVAVMDPQIVEFLGGFDNVVRIAETAVREMPAMGIDFKIAGLGIREIG